MLAVLALLLISASWPWAYAQAPGRWKPLEQALPEAQSTRRLILLDLRAPVTIDGAGDRWIAEAETSPTSARILEGVVLASGWQRTAVVASIPDLAQFKGKKRHLLVLDPWGGVLMEPENAFGDLAKFAFAVNSLRQQTPTFLLAADQRRAGKIAPSLVTWAGGLLDAGALDDAADVFRQAATVAKRDNDAVSLQSAQLGSAALDLRHEVQALKARFTLEAIAAKPATPDIGARAWMLLAHEHRRNSEEKAAIDAYQRSYDLAPKPSPLAEAARRHLETLGSAPKSDVSAMVTAGNVHLLYPRREVMVGNIDFGVATSADAARVEIFLDGARLAELTSRPFRTKVALGDAPHVRTLRAVAWDAKDRQLGEESVTLNGAAVSLAVNIVAPVDDAVAEKTMVEVQTRIPEGKRLAGVDLYWNETKLATMTDPPFRREVVLPSRSAAGYIRAVVRDDSGAIAEDVKLINAAGPAEQVRVDAVQVYAIVQDRQQHYIDGLVSEDFAVKEDGRPVSARVQSAKDDPVSIGLALDTSASMRVAMNEVMGFANEFVQSSLGKGDQTFVVAFDEQPRLLQPLTADRRKVASSIDTVSSSGGTAMWDAMLFSLQQFHDVPGKRALVVFTDAENNGGHAVPNAVLQYAREVGVPVYVVQIFTGIHRSLDMSFSERNVENITKLTGGNFFRFAGKKELPRIFSQIRDDTRGEYLLTYVSPAAGKPKGEMRKISVEVPRRQVTVRATSGYYPR
jgi:VWFA-related protein